MRNLRYPSPSNLYSVDRVTPNTSAALLLFPPKCATTARA